MLNPHVRFMWLCTSLSSQILICSSLTKHHHLNWARLRSWVRLLNFSDLPATLPVNNFESNKHIEQLKTYHVEGTNNVPNFRWSHTLTHKKQRTKQIIIYMKDLPIDRAILEIWDLRHAGTFGAQNRLTRLDLKVVHHQFLQPTTTPLCPRGIFQFRNTLFTKGVENSYVSNTKKEQLWNRVNTGKQW